MSKSEQFQRPRGTKDILPDEWSAWDAVFNAVARVARDYNFGRIATPAIEDTALFERGVGEATDIVQKEMYSFSTSGGKRLTLRPEGTAPITRAYIENGMKSWPQPVKLWYWGPMYRHERPQRGRYREFYQFGMETLGDDDPVLDAEIIQMTVSVLEALGLSSLLVLVNSIGCQECRPSYVKELKGVVAGQKKKLCKDCRARVDEQPLRVLDCKEDKCRQIAAQAPHGIDSLCEECHKALSSVLEYLDALQIPYFLDPYLVRGLDYYTRTVFEVVVNEREKDEEAGKKHGEAYEDEDENDEGNEYDNGGRQIALAGGGRYDNLVEMIGGGDVPAVGAAAGVERILEEIERQGVLPDPPLPPRVFLVQLGNDARKSGLAFLEELRSRDISVAHSFSKGSLKSQLKIADKIGADAAFIIGRKEAMADEVILRDMENSVQETVSMSRAVTEVGKILRRKPRALKIREAREVEEKESQSQ